MSIEERIAEFRAGGMSLADVKQLLVDDKFAVIASAAVLGARKVEEERDGLAVEVERLRESLSPSAVKVAERARGLGLEDLATEIELLGDGRTEEQFRADCNGCPVLKEMTADRATAVSGLSRARTEIVQAAACLRGTLGFVDGVSLLQMAKEVASAYHSKGIREQMTRAEKDEYNGKLREIRAVADALTREPSVRQVGHTLLGILDGAPPFEQVGGVDLGSVPTRRSSSGRQRNPTTAKETEMKEKIDHVELDPGAGSGESFLVRKPEETKEKSLHNSNVDGAKKNVPDLVVYGNGDLWRLLCKASSEEEGWMKSTKVMEVGPGLATPRLGCLVQVTTQQKNPDGSYAVAEAVAFVPGAAFASFQFPEPNG